ncbi:unnamed protein product [Acanthoscelides obtectus]|uniref:Mitochondrial ATP synthase regulatory component factor B n=1 Tax=Acanthoscelides obtectus TaxID=200917 RepID=A0A9P0LEG7_ACAOB|nr:unnamed protein product [Acanthoscelides obtectus]CAK1643060.1 ATP synthase subunit s, mitochondrial [Acanthoscelides obtectus]
MTSIVTTILKPPALLLGCKRTLFHWINLQFNVVDEQRIKQFGADRACAEWILRNGGTIKWTNTNEYIKNYNLLPPEGTNSHIQEVDATNSSIMYNGFDHFNGCHYVTKLILHKCHLVDDQALEKLHYLKKSLLFLQVTSCSSVTDKGLLALNSLSNLKQLILDDLSSVKNHDKTVQALKSSIPTCNIQYK